MNKTYDIDEFSITELHEKKLLKEFFEIRIKEPFNNLPPSLCRYSKFAQKSCLGLSCDECLLYSANREKLEVLLNPPYKIGDWIIINYKSSNVHINNQMCQIEDIVEMTYSGNNCSLVSIRHATDYEKFMNFKMAEFNLNNTDSIVINLTNSVLVVKPLHYLPKVKQFLNSKNPNLKLLSIDNDELPMIIIQKIKLIPLLIVL